jgi:hypothetical protein
MLDAPLRPLEVAIWTVAPTDRQGLASLFDLVLRLPFLICMALRSKQNERPHFLSSLGFAR